MPPCVNIGLELRATLVWLLYFHLAIAMNGRAQNILRVINELREQGRVHFLRADLTDDLKEWQMVS
jgi:hypothetical protein